MFRGDVVADDAHAADLAVNIDRPIAVGPPHVLAAAVTRDRHQLIDMPGRSLAGHDVVDLGTDDVPYLFPARASASAQRTRMPLGTHRRAIGVVVELDQFGAPPDEHRVA